MGDYENMTVKELRPMVSQIKGELREYGVKIGDKFKNMKKKMQMVEFLESYDDGYFDKKKSKKRNRKSKKGGPKRPRNSWIYFSTEKRSEYAERFSSSKKRMEEEYREYRRKLKEGDDNAEKKSALNVNF